MSNHIKAKFLGFGYGVISQEKFSQMIPDLSESLRNRLPVHTRQPVQAVKVSLANENLNAHPETLGEELYMVDAKGLWGVRIGNRGIAITVAKYLEFEAVMHYLEDILRTLADELRISHFSQVSLRNINLFKEVPGHPNKFADINEGVHWGRQEIAALSSGFPCTGAATKHVYQSANELIQLQLSSAVVMPSQSYIPQDEWGIWKLHGKIPALEETQLMIDISSVAFQSATDKLNGLSEYSWEMVSKEFNKLHDLVHKVYADITKD
ncbi:MAG: hypothetical protein DRQ47_06785 [Gammaproteobacteria bacterium]|nr:MAG: hypothetical protein DRQ47_06785 [Gammaproteobacteria bacterium]